MDREIENFPVQLTTFTISTHIPLMPNLLYAMSMCTYIHTLLHDEGACSDWFEVVQGLRQVCALSPLLFNVFFAAILLVAQERFCEDADIVADLARFQR